MPPCVAVVDRYIIPGLQEKFNRGYYFAQRERYFLLAQKVTKDAPRGMAPTNTSPQASVHSHHTPWTPFTWDAFL